MRLFCGVILTKVYLKDAKTGRVSWKPKYGLAFTNAFVNALLGESQEVICVHNLPELLAVDFYLDLTFVLLLEENIIS
jgi:hypothetical protein